MDTQPAGKNPPAFLQVRHQPPDFRLGSFRILAKDDPDAEFRRPCQVGGPVVDEEDLGRVIGRGGRVANALRSLARAAAVREERRVLVDILD